MASSPPPPQTRRTRFVCISDTHNCTVKLPDGDVLIHCGDLTNTGGFIELEKQLNWLARAPHETKIVIAGNHDVTLDTAFYADYGSYFHSKLPQIPANCQALITKNPSLVYLLHESRTIRLRSPDGPHTEFTIFGSPYTPEFMRWAFMYKRFQEDEGLESSKLWNGIPLDTDILVTHGPAFGHLDETVRREAVGCEGLRQAMWRVRPMLALCGHIHESRGVERVRWDLESQGVRYKELGTETWEDTAPEGDKICRVDLTTKGGKPIDNDRSRAVREDDESASMSASGYSNSPPSPPKCDGALPGLGSRGLSGNSDSARGDQSALVGRLGRRETCIVNCAIQSMSYPHRGVRKLNKPIVVDLDLPVWKDDGM